MSTSTTNASLRMYCIDTEALVFMFNGGSPNGFTIHLDGHKVPLLVYTNHINNKKLVHHGFLAPWPYLCSTSLTNLATNQSIINLSLSAPLPHFSSHREALHIYKLDVRSECLRAITFEILKGSGMEKKN